MSKTFIASINGEDFTISRITGSSVTVNGTVFPVRWQTGTNGITLLSMNGKTSRIYCQRKNETVIEIWVENEVVRVELQDNRTRLLSMLGATARHQSGRFTLLAPMPGLVRAIEVREGDVVEKGAGLIILEAMKMENELRAEVQGTVRDIKIQIGQAVEKDQMLLTIETHPA